MVDEKIKLGRPNAVFNYIFLRYTKVFKTDDFKNMNSIDFKYNLFALKYTSNLKTGRLKS